MSVILKTGSIHSRKVRTTQVGSPMRNTAREDGFTMVEVLVALLVLSVGLLGLAMLQATGLRYNNDSYMRSQATILAYDLIDRIRANKAAAVAGAYCLTSTTPCQTTAAPSTELCGDTLGCGTNQLLAQYDVSRWYALQDLYMAKAATASSITAKNINTAGGNQVYEVTITMRWNERGTDISQSWLVNLL